LLDDQNNNAAKSFDIPATNLNDLHNYFDSPTKLFSDLSIPKYNTSAKSFFPYNIYFEMQF